MSQQISISSFNGAYHQIKIHSNINSSRLKSLLVSADEIELWLEEARLHLRYHIVWIIGNYI